MPFLSLPDGTSMKVPEGISEDAAFKLARDKYPEAFPEYAEHEKKTGLISATKSGFKSGAGSALEGLGNLFGSQDLAGYGKDVQQTAGQEYEPTTEADIGVGKRQGITSLLGKGISKYITEPVGQAVGSVAGRYGAPIAAGTAAGVLAPEGAVLGAGASALAFAATNFPIHFGEDISAQKNAGKEVDYGKALVPAMVQTAVDSLGGAIVGGAMKGIALKTATQEAQLLAPKVLSGLLKPEEATAQISGKLMSIVKGTAEAAGAGTLMSTVGQAGQRVASGQDVFSPEALNEYAQSAKDMGLVAPFFGMLHAGQPARAKRLIDEAKQKYDVAEKTKADAAQAAHYASPEGQAEFQQARNPIIQEINDLKELLKAKDLPKDQKKEGKTRLDELQKQLNELHTQYGVENAPTAEGTAPATLEQRLEALRQKRTEDAAAQEAVLQQARTGLNLGEDKPKATALPNAIRQIGTYSNEQGKEVPQYAETNPTNLTVREKETAATKEQTDKEEMLQHRFMLENTFKPNVERQIDDVQTKLQEAIKSGDTATARALAGNLETLRKSLEATDLQLEALPKPEPTVKEKMDSLDKEIKKHNADLQKFSGETFDRTKFEAALDKLEKAKSERDKLEEPPAPVQQGLAFEPTKEEKAHAKRLKELTDTFGPEDQHLVGQLVDTVNAGAKERGLVNANEPLPEKVSPRNKLAAANVEQRRAHDTLADLVDDLRSSEPINSVHAAPGVIGHYITHALKEVNAKREEAKQKLLTTDESLKLAFDIKDTLDKVVANKNESVLKRENETQPTQLEKQLTQIKAKYEQGESKYRRPSDFPDEFSLRQERDATQRLQSELAKESPNLELVKKLRQEVEAGRKENARLETERAKQEEVDMERYAPSGVNPDQYSLFKEKELEPIATVRATPANFMKFVHVQSAKLKNSMAIAKAALEKAAEKDKVKGTSAAQDRAKMEAESAKKAPLIGRLTARLEDSFAENKEAAKARSDALRKIFSLPLENKLIADIRKTKKEIKKYEKIAAGERLHKFKEGYQKYADQLKATVEQAEDYLDKIRKRETQLFTIEGENNKRSVQMTRKVLKEALDENKVTEKQAAPISREIDRLEAVNQAEIEKRATETRLAEQEALERQASLPSIRQEMIGTNVVLPGTKDEILQKRVVKKTVPLTKEEKIAQAREKAKTSAEESAADKINTKKRVEEGLTLDKDITDVLQRQAMRTAERLGNKPAKEQRLKPLKGGPEEKIQEEGITASSRAKLNARQKRLNEKLQKDFAEGLAKPDYYEGEGGAHFYKGSIKTVYRIDEATGKERVELSDARKTVEAFNAKLGNGIKKVVYADRFEDLTPEDKAKFEGAEEDARKMKGAVTPDGTMFVIGEHHPDLLDIQRTLAHEAFGHYGFDRLVGKKGLFDLANKIEAEGGIVEMATKMGVRNDVLDAIREAKRMGYSEEVQKVQALREMVAHIEQGRLDDSMLKRAGRFVKEMIGAIRNWMRENGLGKFAEKTSDADILYMLRKSRDAMTGKGELKGEGFEKTGYRKATPTDKTDPRYVLSEALVAKEKSAKDKLKGNLVAFNTQFVDRLAPLKEIFRREGEKGPVLQMMYNLLAHGQRTNVTSEIVSNGARSFVRDPITGEMTIKSAGGPGGKDIVAALLESKAGNPQALSEMFTGYVAAKRANNVGYEKLVRDGEINGVKITKDMLAAAEKAGDADPAFVKAFETYQKYNNGLVDMLAESGTISKDKAAQLKSKNYIPYYRSRGGVVDLVIGNESPIRIGSLKDQPYLHELVGGEEKIQDFFKSMVANTNMITEMTLRNNATSSVANTLQGLGIAEVRKGNGPAAPDVIRFKSNGKDYHAVIDTSKNAEFSDISPQLLVKGMEGIPTQLPGIVKMLGVPANWLRKGVTRNPFYAYKQLVRDPISAWLTTGANFMPILSSLKEVNRALRGGSETAKRLQEAGILGGEVFTGRAEDLHQIVTHLESGKITFNGAMTLLDKMATEADASTRSVLYDSLRKQGLTDMQAQIATMESMNFNTRGASPSMHWMNTMVPFFNSAIQGYNVMYKAFTGKMPFAKQLELQNKLIKRGSLIAGMSILYAIANQDTEAYKNATPDQRYLNWIIPGMGKEGKEGFRLPIPFEAGYIFKAFPEALVNLAYSDDKAKEGLDAIKAVVNASTPSVIPTAIKAPLEMAMNKSLFTGQDIESKRLLAMEPGQRAYDNTSEAAKQLGSMLNVSPVQIDYLARNYFGGMYTTISSLVNPAIVDSANVKPEGTMSDLPVFGQMFQPQDAGGITQRAYQVMEKASQKSATFKHITDTGDEKKAQEYMKANEAEIGVGESASTMRAQLDQINGAIRALKEQRLPTGMAPAQFATQKRQQLDQLLQARAQMAKDFTATLAETKRQSSR
jgi:hypothetical protein